MNSTEQSTKTHLWIGVDVDSQNLVAATSEGNQLPQTFARTPAGVQSLLQWAKAQLDERSDVTLAIAMESTGCYSNEVHHWIAELDETVIVYIANPKIMKDYLASRNPRRKTDADDALGIAAFARERNPKGTELPSPARQELRDVVRARSLLLKQREAILNHQSTTRNNGRQQKVLTKAAKQLTACIEELEKEAQKIVTKDEALAKDATTLESMFGVGKITTFVILSELGDLRRFESAKQLASYCGMTPKIVQSGRSEKRPRLSKVGSPDVRRALYMAALVTIRHNKTAVAQAYVKLIERGMAKRNALVRVMRKILDQMYYLIKTGRPYEAIPQSKSAGV
jgi:transposase